MKSMLALAAATAAALAAPAAPTQAAERGDSTFIVTYLCDGGRYLSVGYPAYRDAQRAPIRISWQGRTVQLSPSRMVGSGTRYQNAMSNLEWWSKGNGGTLRQIQPSRALLTNCVES
jgi:membrane-bound inhibitor of C-type lysozyme